MVAHALPQRAKLSFPFSTWMEFVPFDINVFVCADFQVVE